VGIRRFRLHRSRATLDRLPARRDSSPTATRRASRTARARHYGHKASGCSSPPAPCSQSWASTPAPAPRTQSTNHAPLSHARPRLASPVSDPPGLSSRVSHLAAQPCLRRRNGPKARRLRRGCAAVAGPVRPSWVQTARSTPSLCQGPLRTLAAGDARGPCGAASTLRGLAPPSPRASPSLRALCSAARLAGPPALTFAPGPHLGRHPRTTRNERSRP
jgi:hypothetical protein